MSSGEDEFLDIVPTMSDTEKEVSHIPVSTVSETASSLAQTSTTMSEDYAIHLSEVVKERKALFTKITNRIKKFLKGHDLDFSSFDIGIAFAELQNAEKMSEKLDELRRENTHLVSTEDRVPLDQKFIKYSTDLDKYIAGLTNHIQHLQQSNISKLAALDLDTEYPEDEVGLNPTASAPATDLGSKLTSQNVLSTMTHMPSHYMAQSGVPPQGPPTFPSFTDGVFEYEPSTGKWVWTPKTNTSHVKFSTTQLSTPATTNTMPSLSATKPSTLTLPFWHSKLSIAKNLPVMPNNHVPANDRKSIPKLQLPKFGGKDNESYPLFQNMFKAAFGSKGCTADELTLHLLNCLEGRPRKLVSDIIAMGIDDHTYAHIWGLLDDSYGGEIVENQLATRNLERLKPPTDYSFSEMTRLMDVLTPLYTYNVTHCPHEIQSPLSNMFAQIKRKLPEQMLFKFLEFCRHERRVDCFDALYDFFKIKHETARRAHKESAASERLSRPKPTSHMLAVVPGDKGFEFSSDEDEADNEDATVLALQNHPESSQTSHSKSFGDKFRQVHFKQPVKPVVSHFATKALPTRSTPGKPFPRDRCPLGCKTAHKNMEDCLVYKNASCGKKFTVVNRYRLCFRCLDPKHRAKACSFTHKCGVGGCTRYHHPSLHPSMHTTLGMIEDYGSDAEFSDVEDEDEGDVRYVAGESAISTGTLTAKIVVNGAVHTAVVLLDTGSSDTYIDEAFAAELGILNGQELAVYRRLSLVDRGIKKRQYPVSFTIQSNDGLFSSTIESWTMQGLSRDTGIVDWSMRAQNIAHLQGLKFAQLPPDPKVQIIIGCDNAGFFAWSAIKSDPKDITAPVAVLSPLGWTCLGRNLHVSDDRRKHFGSLARVQSYGNELPSTMPLKSVKSGKPHTFFADNKKKILKPTLTKIPDVLNDFSNTENQELHKLVTRAWDLDVLGMSEKVSLVCGTKNQRKPCTDWTPQEKAIDDKMVVKFIPEEGRFSCAVPWSQDPPNLVNNLTEVRARQRRTNSAQYLSSKGITAKDIDDKFVDHLSKNYIREVTDAAEICRKDCFYLPYFPVVKTESTTKVRLVFDCAAKNKHGLSLNDAISKGPNRLQDLLTILIRFRRFKWALTADVSEMFLQVRLPEPDRRFHRFWWDDKIFEWISILFGNQVSPDSSQKVLEQICSQFGDPYPIAVKAIQESMYMDDGCESLEQNKDCQKLAVELPSLLGKGGMKVHKIYSNCKKAIVLVPENLRSSKVHFSDKEDVFEASKVLGMVWDAQTDEFQFSCKYPTIDAFLDSFKGSRPQFWTKRLILRFSATMYDPLGYASWFSTRARALLQALWQEKLDWDDKIPEKFSAKWDNWLNELFELPKLIKIPRCLKLTSYREISLHVFADASTEAMCACVYIRLEPATSRGQNEVDNIDDENVDVSLVISKARVTPIKTESVSRLELGACVIAVRLGVTVAQIFKLDPLSVNYWTDSKNCLFWMNTPSKFLKTFVSNRVGEIQTFSSVTNWRHVPTDQNPADIPTREISVYDMPENDLWWKGPNFLIRPESQWPSKFDGVVNKDVILNELKKDAAGILDGVCMFAVNKSEKVHDSKSRLDPGNYSVGRLWNGFQSLMRHTALLFMFIILMVINKAEKLNQDHLFNLAMARATEFHARHAQEEDPDYVQLINSLKLKSDDIPSRFRSYSPYLTKTGLVRCHSRLANVENLDYETKFPILLPANSTFTQLLVGHYHVIYEHTVGIGSSKMHIRNKFIIPQLENMLRKIRAKCTHCKRQRAVPLEQQMADLPSYRFSQPLRAFAKTGIDFCGPFDIKVGRGKVRAKSYILVFTCLQTRAIHLEPTDSQSADSVINALSRFADIRGMPTEILSDNWSSFVNADKELESWVRCLQKDLILDTLKYKVVWHFTPPKGPHHGGIYEIMVKSTKRALKIVSENLDLNMEEFHTFVYRAMNLINDRPLSRVQVNGESIILTPNHFLFGHLGGSVASPDQVTDLKKRWTVVNKLVNRFWSQLFQEYIPELSQRRKWQIVKPNLEVGEIVLELEPNHPRGVWKLGIVQEIYPSEDGKVRRCRIKTVEGIYDRPIVRLCPLEIKCADKPSSSH